MKANPQLLDRCWSWLSMGLVGEQIDEHDEICGAGESAICSLSPPLILRRPVGYTTVVSVRHKVDRIQVWTRHQDKVDVLNGIGKKLYKLLDLNNEPSIGLEFQVLFTHHDLPGPSSLLFISFVGFSVPASFRRWKINTVQIHSHCPSKRGCRCSDLRNRGHFNRIDRGRDKAQCCGGCGQRLAHLGKVVAHSGVRNHDYEGHKSSSVSTIHESCMNEIEASANNVLINALRLRT
jgi:hypothetical protein